MLKGIISLTMLSAFLFTGVAESRLKSICGRTDDRLPSTNSKVARSIKKGDQGGCTITMIGRTCAISAGHCLPTFELAQFNVPASRRGQIQHPSKEDTYLIDKSTLVSKNAGPGNDYAVFRVKKNSITGKLPGDAQGYYNVDLNRTPSSKAFLQITGYGLDRNEPTRNLAQQSHRGPIASIRGRTLHHNVDTKGGNSGSAIINTSTGKIVGIHSHGGCHPSGGQNAGTLISAHTAVKKAIRDCLAWERINL